MGKSITDLSAVATVGSTWPSTSFKFTALMLRGGRVVVSKAMRRNKLLEFLRASSRHDNALQTRRVATRFDALARNFLASVALGSAPVDPSL
jgi:hypothetical protein